MVLMRNIAALCLLLLANIFISTPADANNAFIPDAAQPYVDEIQRINQTLHDDAVFKDLNFGTIMNNCLHQAPSNSSFSQGEWDNKYSARFTYCMREVIEGSTNQILEKVQDYMRTALYSIIFLAMIITGVKGVGGMFQNVRVESAVFVAKIVGAVIVFENMEDISSILFSLVDQILVMVGDGASATFSAGGGGIFQCDVTAVNEAKYGSYKWVKVYDWLDCFFRKLVGVGTSQEMIGSLIAIGASSLFLGVVGAHLAFMILSLFLALGMFLLRVATMMVMAYGAVAMMMFMLPIMILTIFFKVTENYFFQRWLSMIVRNVVQPAVMIGFMYFALAAIDILVYKGSGDQYIKFNASATGSDPVTGVLQDVSYATKASNGTFYDMNNNPVSSSGYEQAVKPMFTVLDLNGTTSQKIVRATEMMSGSKKLFQDWEISADNMAFSYIDKNCGEGGYISALGTSGYDYLKYKFFGSPAEDLEEFFNDPQQVMEAIESAGQPGVAQEEVEKAKKKMCAYLKASRFAGKFEFVRDWAADKVKAEMPEVPILDLCAPRVPDDPDNPVCVGTTHEKKMNAVIIAVVTVLILAGTLFTYTGSIEQMAASITGRMGMGLSINNVQEGARSLAAKVGGTLNKAEESWEQALNSKNASTVDKLGGAAIGSATDDLVKGVSDNLIGKR